MTIDTLPPHRMVEQARAFIRSNIAKKLNISMVAKGIGVTVADLRGSYQCSTPTSFDEDVIKIKLESLYQAIRTDPAEDIEFHLESVGLPNAALSYCMFEEEFWISVVDHQRNCLGLN